MGEFILNCFFDISKIAFFSISICFLILSHTSFSFSLSIFTQANSISQRTSNKGISISCNTLSLEIHSSCCLEYNFFVI